jgi:hypothetical protein
MLIPIRIHSRTLRKPLAMLTAIIAMLSGEVVNVRQPCQQGAVVMTGYMSVHTTAIVGGNPMTTTTCGNR